MHHRSVFAAWLFVAVCLEDRLPQVAAAEKTTPSYAELVLREQPVAYWDFSEGASAKIARSRTLESLDAKLVGKASLGQLGPRPGAYPLFDGSNTALELAGGKDLLQVSDPGDSSPLDFDAGDSLTIEAWVFPRTIGKDQHMVIVSKGRTGNKAFADDNLNYALRLKGHSQGAYLNFLFRSRDLPSDTEHRVKPRFHRWTSDVGFPIDSGWHHVAVTYTFGLQGSLRAYLDGQRIDGQWDMAGDTSAPPHIDNDRLWIGSGQANQNGAFEGWLDEIAIYRQSLSHEQIASHYRLESGLTQSWLNADQVAEDRVQVKLYQGLPDRTWAFSLERPSLEFDIPAMAITQLPNQYSQRGVVEDRILPILVQAYTKRWLASGKYSIMIRAKNAARLWIDEKQVASIPFLTINGDGHEPVPPLPDPPQAYLHPVPQGHRDELVQVELDEGMHVFRLDSMVGGRKLRPEIGEVCIAIAHENDPFTVLTPETGAPWIPTEEAWQRFLDDESARFRLVNQQLRKEASRIESDYWEDRHQLAREVYNQKHAQRLKNNVKTSIDEIIAKSIGDSQKALASIDDYAFLRRVTLDTIGLVPTQADIRAFIADPSADKRTAKIDQLLSDPRWADHWVGYWQDVLAENPGIVKPEQNNTGPFRWWIHESFLDNKPFDRFATELIMMEGSKYYGGPAGFAMASQNDSPMAAKAQTLTKAFLGLEMSCARCHDSPNSPFKQEELFSLAAMLQRGTLALPEASTVPVNPNGRVPLVTMSLKAGDKLAPQWHLASFPSVELQDSLIRNSDDSRERFAAILTSPNNERFPQVIANRLWHRYLGWTLVGSVDDWSTVEAHDSPLLDYLSDALVMSGYDLKHVVRLILQSKVYQASSQSYEDLAAMRRDFHVATGPARRRLSAEQIVDSLFAVAGKSLDVEAMTLDPEGRRPPEQFLHLGFPKRAWQFASTSTDRDRPALMMPAVQQVADVLLAMGWRDSRPTPLTLRDESASPLQSLILGNGLASTKLARLSDDGYFTHLAMQAQSAEQLVDDLYHTILGRPPRPDERLLFVELLEPGFESRRAATNNDPPKVSSHKRNAVSWANHLVPEATRIKLALEQEVLDGDVPTTQLETDWRERMEDATWAILNSPEFLFVP